MADVIASLHRRHYGRDGGHATTRQSGNVLRVVIADVVTPDETFLIQIGRADLVAEFHLAFQRAMRGDFVEAVERSLGRPVRGVSSGFDLDRGVATETYFLGSGAAAAAVASNGSGGAPGRSGSRAAA